MILQHHCEWTHRCGTAIKAVSQQPSWNGFMRRARKLQRMDNQILQQSVRYSSDRQWRRRQESRQGSILSVWQTSVLQFLRIQMHTGSVKPVPVRLIEAGRRMSSLKIKYRWWVITWYTLRGCFRPPHPCRRQSLNKSHYKLTEGAAHWH